ncbi:MAG TPA: hypothetical protein VN634_17405 [Candidatus Limnocylindrales bacterium]|nr:hypothetical protein [Candidatus Limnocylindrales bacterium]
MSPIFKHQSWLISLFAVVFLFAAPSNDATAFADESDVPSARAQPTRVSVESLGVRYDDNGAHAELEIRNAGKQAITYGGYSSTSPAYRTQCFTNGSWKDEAEGWCGNGLETQTLRPGQKIRFTAPLCPFPQSTKIGVVVGTPQDKAGQPVWSEAIVEKVR